MKIGDLTDEHKGKRIKAELMAIQGWLPHLILMSATHSESDTTELMFLWDNDPNPSNSRRGEFACGVTVPSDMECEVSDEPIYIVTINPDVYDEVERLRQKIANQPMTQNVSYKVVHQALLELRREAAS